MKICEWQVRGCLYHVAYCVMVVIATGGRIACRHSDRWQDCHNNQRCRFVACTHHPEVGLAHIRVFPWCLVDKGDKLCILMPFWKVDAVVNVVRGFLRFSVGNAGRKAAVPFCADCYFVQTFITLHVYVFCVSVQFTCLCWPL